MTESAPREGAAGISRSAAAFYALAFFSGAAALVYEVTWAKMLALTFGSTTLSAAATVAGFLGWMGIGAALCHRWSRRAKNPLRLYALIELGIAIVGAAISSTFYALPEWFGSSDFLSASPRLEVCVRWGVVLLLLAPAAALMGATFPALCRVLIGSTRGADRHLGWIYGINTLGAASGALLAGLFLAERLGLRGASLAANGINVAVAAAASILLRTRRTAPVEPAPDEDLAVPTRLPRACTAIVLLVSGFCTLGYELLWFRGLRYLVGASSYAFSITLFTFLCGLGLGSLALRRLLRRGNPERDLVLVQAVAAVLAVAGISLQALILSAPALYDGISVFVPSVRTSPWGRRLLLDVAAAVATLLPATAVMGLTFPLATRLFLGDVRRVDRSAGRAYLLASIGSIAGAIGGALLLLPRFGVVGGTRLLAALNLAVALVVWLSTAGRARRLGLVLGGAAGVVLLSPTWLPGSLPLVGERAMGGAPSEPVFLEEGDLATVQVLRETGHPARLAMAIDGYKIGWSEGYRSTPFHLKQILIADLPQVLDTRIATTLGIGLGSGGTLAELAARPELSVLDCVEINAAVVRGQKLFPESSVLVDPRVRLHVEDAVHFLLRSRDRYDLVVSDGKQDPFFAGNADLLCLEFYRFARARLSGHGLLVQWFPLATLPGDLRVVLATLCRSFPCVDAFCFPPHSLLLVAGLEPLSGRPALTEPAYAALPMSKSLAVYGLDSAEALRSHWTAGREALEASVRSAPASSWDRQILDVSTFKARGSQWSEANAVNLQALIAAGDASPASGAPAHVDPRRLESARLVRRAWLAVLRERLAEARSLADEATRIRPEDPEVRVLVRILGGSDPR